MKTTSNPAPITFTGILAIMAWCSELLIGRGLRFIDLYGVDTITFGGVVSLPNVSMKEIGANRRRPMKQMQAGPRSGSDAVPAVGKWSIQCQISHCRNGAALGPAYKIANQYKDPVSARTLQPEFSTFPCPMCRRMPGLETMTAPLSSASMRTLALPAQSRHTMHDK